MIISSSQSPENIYRNKKPRFIGGAAYCFGLKSQFVEMHAPQQL